MRLSLGTPFLRRDAMARQSLAKQAWSCLASLVLARAPARLLATGPSCPLQSCEEIIVDRENALYGRNCFGLLMHGVCEEMDNRWLDLNCPTPCSLHSKLQTKLLYSVEVRCQLLCAKHHFSKVSRASKSWGAIRSQTQILQSSAGVGFGARSAD